MSRVVTCNIQKYIVAFYGNTQQEDIIILYTESLNYIPNVLPKPLCIMYYVSTMYNSQFSMVPGYNIHIYVCMGVTIIYYNI